MNFKRSIFRNNQASSPAEAIYRGLFKQVRELLNKEADPDEKIKSKTAIMLCTFLTDTFWAKSLSFTLLEYGAKIDKKDEYGFNALHFSVIKNKKDLVEIFLNSFDFDINSKNNFGFTALHYAVNSESKIEILESLIFQMKKYKYSLNILNKFNNSPLMESIRHLNFHAVEVLIDNGARTDFKYEGLSFLDYFNNLKRKLKETPEYMINKIKKSIIINKNEEISMHDSIIRSVEQISIEEAPDFDIRNNSKWVVERPKSCITLHSFNENEESSWKTIMPIVLNQLEERISKSYRKNFSVEKIISNLKQFNHEAGDTTGKGRNGSSKKSNAKSKLNKKGSASSSQDKLSKRSTNDGIKINKF